MIEQFTSYFKKLERLSSDELHRSAEKLVLAENTSIAKLIAHLAEMSARKTALALGYKSLYSYCIERLNLSRGCGASTDSCGERFAALPAATRRARRESH